MDISVFGFKLNVEILILIGVVYLILVVHTLSGCCNYSLIETFTNASGNIASALQDMSGNIPSPAGGAVAKEGFVGANTNYGQSSPYDLNSSSMINTSSWSAPDMSVISGKPLSQGVKDFLAREPQPIPPPEGQLSMFATTPFKPECCPNTYSTSTGCACMTGQQYNWLIKRGGNNVPYSDF